MIDLSEQNKALIKEILLEQLPNAKIYAFGSRVTGKSTKYSDLDIAVDATDKIDLTTLSTLHEAFSQTNLPFKVDIVDWHRISDEFKAHVRENHIIL